MIFGNDEGLKNNLDIIVTQIDRISKLIYSLLHLSRSSHKEELQSVSVLGVLDEVLLLLAQKTTKLHVATKIEVDPTATVIADRSKLEQVFLNIVMNALQAIEGAAKNGRTENHRLAIQASVEAPFCHILFTDTGTGISEENRAKIFRPFFTTKDVGVGTGLGLAITDQIIRSWGGDISVESQEGVGTQFKISLPSSPSSPVTQPYSRSLR